MTALWTVVAVLAGWLILDIVLLPLWIVIGRAMRAGTRPLDAPLPPESLTGGRPYLPRRDH